MRQSFYVNKFHSSGFLLCTLCAYYIEAVWSNRILRVGTIIMGTDQVFKSADPDLKLRQYIFAISIGGSRGAQETRVPLLGVQILSFSCSFRQKRG